MNGSKGPQRSEAGDLPGKAKIRECKIKPGSGTSTSPKQGPQVRHSLEVRMKVSADDEDSPTNLTKTSLSDCK